MGRPIFDSFAVVTWTPDRFPQEVGTRIQDLSYDAALEIARAHVGMGQYAKVSSQDRDYAEVWDGLGWHRILTGED